MSTNILIADSGSTKTNWSYVTKYETFSLATEGINPLLAGDKNIANIVANVRCQINNCVPSQIFFYGAGCIGGAPSEKVEYAIKSVFPDSEVFVASDLLGAARALCGDDRGVACILGTGANSCLYDGREISGNTPPLGFILGDEGSGSYIGKRILADALKGFLPAELTTDLMVFLGLDYPEIIGKVYRESYPNRFLASIMPFVVGNISCNEVRNIVLESFVSFVERNIAPYGAEVTRLPISFVGSVAWHLRDVLREALELCSLQLGKVLQAPIDGLVEYHRNKI